MKEEHALKAKYGVWGIVSGAVLATVVGFALGGWVTGGSAQSQADEAVLASQAAICVAQFMRESDYDEQMKSFEDISLWTRWQFIEEGGWDKMPGQEKSDNSVAKACADGVTVLAKK